MSLCSDLSVFEKVQGDLYILQLVEAHPAFLPRLQETRGRRTSGGGNTSGLDDQQTSRAPMTEEQVFQVSSNTLCVHNNHLYYSKVITVMVFNLKLKIQQI